MRKEDRPLNTWCELAAKEEFAKEYMVRTCFDPIECAKPAQFGSCHRSDQEWPFPFFVHLSLELVLRNAAKNEIVFFDLPWPYFFIAPYSCLLLVPTKVDGCLCLDGFDRVDCWLDVLIGSLRSVGPMSKLFWGHCLFAVEELEGCELCFPLILLCYATRLPSSVRQPICPSAVP